MKLFLVATELCRTRGGIQYVNRLLARAFAEMARSTPLELHVFAYGDRPPELAQLSGAVADRWHAFDRRGARMARALARELLRQQPDAVLFTHVRLLAFLRLVRLLAPRARTALLAHGVEVWAPLSLRMRRALRKLDSVTAPSAYTAARLHAVNGVPSERLTVLPHSLDPEWAAMDLAPLHRAGTTLLTVARLSLEDGLKGVDVVLRAMPHILERVPEARCIVVGDGDGRPRLEQLTSALGVASRVEFRGEADDRELARAYAEADLFVLPSLKEGFGIVFAEAMWQRLPVVAARAAAANEVVEDGVTGILVPPDAPEQLASAVSGLLLLDDERRRMGDAARARVERLYLFPSFVERWHRWLAGLAPEAVYVARHAALSTAARAGQSRASH